MSDDSTKTDVTQTPEDKGGTVDTEQLIQLTPAQLNARLERERSKFSDYETLKAERENLLAEKKKREEAELTELEKSKNQLAELEAQINELKPFKEREEQRKARILEQVDKELEESELSDDDKDIVNAIADPDKRLAAVKKLKSINGKEEPPRSGHAQGKGNGASGYTIAELDEMRLNNPAKFKEVYPKWKASRQL